MNRIRRMLILITLLTAPLAISAEMPEGRLMRFADIYKDKIVFSYAGDLWLVSSSGGEARRITTDPGLELFPKFSPDGKWIAFTAQYDGNFNVYVMPADGGEPKQLTFEPDITSGARTHGTEQLGHQLASRQPAHSVSLAPRHVQRLVRAAVHGQHRRRPASAPAH